MSVEASKWAWEQRGVSATAKLVLLAIADHSDECGQNAYPSINRLTKKTGLSHKTVCRALKDLRSLGMLKIIKSKTLFGNFERNSYEVPIFPGVVSQCPGGSVTEGGGVVSQRHTNHPKKPSIQPNNNTHTDLPDWVPEAEWKEFLEHRKLKRAPVTNSISKRLLAVLRQLNELGHSPADVLTEAIDRNWTGIKVDWIHKNGAAPSDPGGEESMEEARARQNRLMAKAYGKPGNH